MNRRLLMALLIAGAFAAGIICGDFVYRSVACRDAIGLLCQRGHLLAIVHGDGIYEADLRRARAEWRDAAGLEAKDRHEESSEKRLLLDRLIATAMARSFAAGESISKAKLDGALNLLRWQFRDDKTWRAALNASSLSMRSLRRSIAENLRSEQWIFRKITSGADATVDEGRNYYETNRQNFLQPVRLRASHIFLAAPLETPPEIVDAKRSAIELLFTRLAHGEDFSELAALASEDEATKRRGGDLGYFSAVRLPPDFFAAAMKLRVGQISPPARTRLGFHIIKLTDSKPAQQMTVDEGRGEIALALDGQKRQAALRKLEVNLCTGAEWLPPAPLQPD